MVKLKQLIIDRGNSINKYILWNEKELENLIIENEENKSLVGNIYCGRVLNIVNKNFVFLNIGQDKNAFLDLSDTKEKLLVDDENGKRKLKIKQGDAVLVQVLKDATKEKGVAVTTQINLKKDNLAIYKAKDNQIGISKKITDEDTRNSLRQLGNTFTNNEYSLVFRTSSKDALEEKLKEEYDYLKAKLDDLLEKSQYIKPPSLVLKAGGTIADTAKEIMVEDVEEIICSDEKTLNEIKKEFNNINLRYMENEEYIKFMTTIDKRLEKLFNKKVWLKSGGFIVIEETEACVVIDVNSSKSIKGKNPKEFALKTNKEAVNEIAKQVKLRNLSGMIIIDFIDMRAMKDKENLLKYAKYIFNQDRTKTFVVSITELGLMQVTRKKTREPISQILRRECAYCNGVGSIPKNEIIINKIFKEVFSLVVYTIFNKITVKANEKVIEELLNPKNIAMFENIENNYNVKIDYKPIKTGRIDYFEIDKLKE